MPRPPSQPPAPGVCAPRTGANTVSGKRPESSQRERLCKAIARVVAREGYAAASVAQVIAAAGVSRATFYAQFTDKHACLLSAYDQLTARLATEMTDAAASEPAQRPRAALAALLQTLETEPEIGWRTLVEPLGGGVQLRAHGRRRALQLADALERSLAESEPEPPCPDVPPLALIGGARHVICRRLRRSEYDALPLLDGELIAWMDSYALAPGQRPWATGPARQASPPAPARGAIDTPGEGVNGASHAAAAQRLPRGRRRLRESVIARQLRERIVGATAQVALERGYAEMRVADIVAHSGVGRNVFYDYFRDKRDAFNAAQRDTLHIHLSECTASFFEAAPWPRRVWNALGTLIEILVEDPALAHLRIVESFSAGPEAVAVAEEIMLTLSFYAQEGHNYGPHAEKLPPVCAEAVAGAIYEILYHEIDAGQSAQLRSCRPQLTYIAIAPFTGAAQAAQLIEEYMKG
jgi:AcrR family transcriptional regulator